MVVLCIGDSCGLPRPELPYIDTWPSLLVNKFPQIEFVNLCKRSNTTSFLFENKDALEYYSPNKIILQLGIVDCAPRYLRNSRVLYKIVQRLPAIFQKYFWLYWKSTHKRSPKQAYTTISEFRYNLKNYIERCATQNVESVILIKIATPTEEMIKSNPLIKDSVKLYNRVYEQLESEYPFVITINPLSGDAILCFNDGYHPNIEGNKRIFSELAYIL